MTSVLFGDLVGFTTLSESRDPEEVRELLSRYFDSAREIVARYGGTIEKFIGDAVMAVWGVPTAHEDDAERAVRAGLDLVEAVTAFGESVGAPGLSMRVGVVTGEVAVTLGATNQGMVAGDAVNTAARVQTKAEPGTVWTDTQTRSLASGSIDFLDAGQHELKGKAEPVPLYRATAVRGGVGGDRSTDRVQAPLIGRRRESAMLRELFHAVEEDLRPQLVVITGDAGVGKSRLARELENYIDGLSRSVLWHQGRCQAWGEGVAYSALTTAVRSRIDASPDDDAATDAAKLDASLAEFVPDAEERDWLRPRLATLLGGGTEAVGRQDLFGAWLTWFERLSQADGEPVVWVIDDAQHADDGMLDFVEHLATVAQAPILIVVLARPELVERRPGLAGRGRTTVLGLSTLSRADIATLLDSLVEGLPETVRDKLVDRVEGNPLYAVETVRAMADEGLAVAGPVRTPGALRVAEHVDAEALHQLSAPASLQVLVASRLDQLEATQRSVLAAASVLGQTFTIEALVAVAERDSAQVQDAVRELMARDILTTITERLSVEVGRISFVQTVVRAVAYQTQARRDRRRRHLIAAHHLESRADAADDATVIADHLREALALDGADDRSADLSARLCDWLERSAQRRLSVGAPAEALRDYTEAVGLAGDPEIEIRLRLAAADAALRADRPRIASEQVEPLLERSGPAAMAAAGLGARALHMQGDGERAADLLRPYLDEELLLAAEPISAYRIAIEQHYVLRSNKTIGEGLVWAERAVLFAERSESPAAIVHSINNLGTSLLYRGQRRLGMHLYELAIELGRQYRLAAELSMALNNAIAFGLLSDLTRTLELGAEALDLVEQSGNPSDAILLSCNLAVASRLRGRFDDVDIVASRPLVSAAQDRVGQAMLLTQRLLVAEACDRELDLVGLTAAIQANSTGAYGAFDAIWIDVLPALHAHLTGDHAAAAQAGLRLLDIAYGAGGLEDDYTHHFVLAVEWMLDAGDFDSARRVLAAVESAPHSEVPLLLLAELHRLRGTAAALDPSSTRDPGEIESDLRAAVDQLGRIGARADQARAQATLGSWLHRTGRPTEAAEPLATARATFAEIGATRWLRDLDQRTGLQNAG